MPGPLFNFSAYLGAIIAYNAGQPFIIGTVLAWFGLFAPGVMLMFAVRAGCCRAQRRGLSTGKGTAPTQCGIALATSSTRWPRPRRQAGS